MAKRFFNTSLTCAKNCSNCPGRCRLAAVPGSLVQDAPFLTSSHSGGVVGSTQCVQVAPFRKASHSPDTDPKTCVEVGVFELR
jgi:hypothetical protein